MCIPSSSNVHDAFIGILEMFKAVHCGLQFTYELPVNACLQFLDLSIKKCSEHTCWSYRTRSEKGLLPFDSAHTKLIKRGIAFSCLSNAVKKSCHHRITESLSFQVSRLKKSGYRDALLVSVSEKVLRTVVKEKGCRSRRCERTHATCRLAIRPWRFP